MALNGDPDVGHYGLKTLPGVTYLAEVTFAEQAPAHGEHGGAGEGGEGKSHNSNPHG